ncbi:hypothetical protein HPB47_017456 [Ixodes persulcatus]|uniref:Uncharacterized protein n=1 Tax=Ixodes persulcatus TaxID=34615 RepID=A0AC60QRY6_IXOPE|nr:hypothetical protein HPB47_017456 [Ixodes persulcatus]
MDDDSECFFEQTSESVSVDVGCQANIHLATRKKTQTSTQGRSIGIKKKIVAVARTKQHSVLLKWLKTIVRHLHWCARTSNGDNKLVMAKWTSLIRHISDVHQHLDSLHPSCEHGDVPDRLWLAEADACGKISDASVLASLRSRIALIVICQQRIIDTLAATRYKIGGVAENY